MYVCVHLCTFIVCVCFGTYNGWSFFVSAVPLLILKYTIGVRVSGVELCVCVFMYLCVCVHTYTKLLILKFTIAVRVSGMELCVCVCVFMYLCVYIHTHSC